jgi:hypothetical protein
MNFKEWLITESKKFTSSEINKLAKKIKVDISNFEMKELIDGMGVEQEHMHSKKLDVIKGDNSKILKIALAHLKEDPHYYKKLKKLEL